MAKHKKKKSSAKSKISPTKPRNVLRSGSSVGQQVELYFGKKNYLWMLAGFGLILLGLFLMSGGAMPSPDVWDDSLIYSFRRITLAPILILAGLVIEVLAIFK